MVIPGADAGAEWSIWPGARTAGLGGPCGRIKRKNMRHSAIDALVTMRRVICRLAMFGAGGGEWGKVVSPRVRSREHLGLVSREYSRAEYEVDDFS